MPSRKLLEQCQKLDKSWNHIFTASINLDQGSNEAIWYSKLTEIIEKQQTSPIWMSESKVFAVFKNLFTYFSYAKEFDHI